MPRVTNVSSLVAITGLLSLAYWPNVDAAPAVADCFALKAGVHYVLGEDEKVQIDNGQFGDQKTLALTTIKPGSKSKTYFDQTGRQILGVENFGDKALGSSPDEVLSKEVYTAPYPTFPADIKVGGSFKVTGKGSLKVAKDSADISYEDLNNTDYTFVGFEKLALKPNKKPRTFDNACHFSVTKDNMRVADYWYVAPYGIVKYQVTDNDEGLIEAELSSLTE